MARVRDVQISQYSHTILSSIPFNTMGMIKMDYDR